MHLALSHLEPDGFPLASDQSSLLIIIVFHHLPSLIAIGFSSFLSSFTVIDPPPSLSVRWLARHSPHRPFLRRLPDGLRRVSDHACPLPLLRPAGHVRPSLHVWCAGAFAVRGGPCSGPCVRALLPAGVLPTRGMWTGSFVQS